MDAPLVQALNQETRYSGHWIVAQQGMGKTTLLLSMIAADLQRDCSIIVMDSKGELTGAIRQLNLGDRLIVIDPDTPIALNPFDATESHEVVSHLGYMLGGLLETNITAKQRTFFETLVQALLHFPNPSLPLLWDIVSKGPRAYTQQIQQLPEDLPSFFTTEWETYSDTAREMQWRLRGILGKPLLKKMFNVTKTRFHIGQAMDRGKVVVIDNSQAKCTAEGSGFLGRIFIAQIWSAGTARALRPDHLKKPTFVYIDEAHLVIKKDQKIASIIDELRSQKVGLIMAHQKVRGQIDDLNVLSSLENCAIKMVNVKAEAPYFSRLMDIPEEHIRSLDRGQFATEIRGEQSCIIQVSKAQLPFKLMTPYQQAALKREMIEQYGIKHEAPMTEASPVKLGMPAEPTSSEEISRPAKSERPSSGVEIDVTTRALQSTSNVLGGIEPNEPSSDWKP